MTKKTAYTAWSILLCLLLVAAAALPARAESVDVRFGAHKDYKRIVFDFPKLTAYRVTETGNGIEIVFDTPYAAQKQGRPPAGITAVDITRPDTETMKVRIDSKGEFRHYRLQRKVVVDVYGIAAPPPEPPRQQAQKKPPPEKQPAPESQKPAPEQAAAPPPPAVPEPVPEPAKTAEIPAPRADDMPPPAAAPVERVAAEELREEKTKITISTVSMARLGVFKRFGMLWVVMDTEVGSAFTPEVSGPKAGVLGRPALLRSPGGSAWRYTMPPGYDIEVERRNLTWNIYLSPGHVVKNRGKRINVETDRASGKSKLMVELPGAGQPVTVQDPVSGDTLYVVPTARDDVRVDQPRRFPDVEILPAEMGMVVRPLGDGVQTHRIGDYVTVSSEGGIIASTDVVASVVAVGLDKEDDAPAARLFDFLNWRRGGLEKFHVNRRRIEAEIAAARTVHDRQAALMNLAFLHFANNFGHETLGILRILSDEDADIAKNPNFIALRGAARAMARHYREAQRDLSDPAIQHHPEVRLWLGYAAAATEQWHMANRMFPSSNRLLLRYPDNISIPITLYMAESALRLGRTDTAGALLSSLSMESRDFLPEHRAAAAYLRGETLRQEGNPDAAMRVWIPVANGINRLYHTKASLALANLNLQEGEMTLQEAIDEVDSLRFAWRGDGLEVQILHNLGQLRVQNGQYLEGLQDMQRAAELADSLLSDSAPIRADMQRALEDIFIGGQAEKLSPLEAVSIYSAFGNMIPAGAEAMRASLRFAGYLIRMDLLDRAAEILERGLDGGNIPEAEVSGVGARLAAAYLMGGQPEKALMALGRTERGGISAQEREERGLLRARAQSQMGKTDDAIATLSVLKSEDARRLKADVLWRARRWPQVAEAMEALLPPPGDLGEDGARLALNTAVALKLANADAKLEAFKDRYGAAMKNTRFADAFSVVTRESGPVSLTDRDTLLKIAGEVDMFSGFLESYKAAGKTGG